MAETQNMAAILDASRRRIVDAVTARVTTFSKRPPADEIGDVPPPSIIDFVTGGAVPALPPVSMVLVVQPQYVRLPQTAWGPEFELVNNYYDWSQGHLIACG